ncbi:hypothetical protein CYOC110262_10165 [Cytobacillus oceanisediminis]|uniref:Uncharacterized protein n=1 Tax=Cytobacillus oceanisediminis TaxID=665099 RepID=A0A562K3E0_9BACI|nr:hypothetical protein IQ19_00982 [Cytobacillus oceanisediminis]
MVSIEEIGRLSGGFSFKNGVKMVFFMVNLNKLTSKQLVLLVKNDLEFAGIFSICRTQRSICKFFYSICRLGHSICRISPSICRISVSICKVHHSPAVFHHPFQKSAPSYPEWRSLHNDYFFTQPNPMAPSPK